MRKIFASMSRAIIAFFAAFEKLGNATEEYATILDKSGKWANSEIDTSIAESQIRRKNRIKELEAELGEELVLPSQSKLEAPDAESKAQH